MNVVREDVDALNAILKVEVKPADYEGKVKETLNKYRKTANVPGFRAGHVPFGLVQKQYGKSVLSEELNKMVNESLQKYISENKLEILGNPIPQGEGGFTGDFEKPADFEFERFVSPDKFWLGGERVKQFPILVVRDNRKERCNVPF